jgi:hypothetical protein
MTAALADSEQENVHMKILATAAFLASMIAGSSFANAMPLASAGQTAGADVIQVAGGCGPGFHRGPYGDCRPNVYRGPVIVGAPVVVRPIVRGCPPGFFMGRYGRCRPI